MKTTLLLLLTTMFGCSTREITIGEAHYKSSLLFGKEHISGITFKNGDKSLTVKGYSSDQVAGMAEIAEAAARGAVTGVKP